MNSTAPSQSGFFSSPRRQQWLMWASGAVLAIGVAVFLGVYLSRGSSSQASSPNVSTIKSPPAQTTPAPQQVKVSHDALQVARTFLTTAVQRKNLAAAYGIVGPLLRGGLSLKQWNTGNIPVTPYPAFDAKTSPFAVKSSTKNEVFLDVWLHPAKGSGIQKPQAFKVGIDRIGGKWLVNYFLPDYTAPVKANPYNN